LTVQNLVAHSETEFIDIVASLVQSRSELLAVKQRVHDSDLEPLFNETEARVYSPLFTALIENATAWMPAHHATPVCDAVGPCPALDERFTVTNAYGGPLTLGQPINVSTLL
jgi:hypothetical protein